MAASNLIQFLTNAAILCSSVFIPLLAEQYGAGPIMVGLVVAVYNLFFMISNYSFGYFSDRFGGRYFLYVGLVASSLFFALQVFANDLTSLFVFRALAGFMAGTFPAALAVYAYSEQSGRMGSFAGYGSLGWGIGAVVAGFITDNNLIFIISALFFLTAFFLSFQLNRKFERPQKVSIIPWRVLKNNLRIYLPFFLRALGAQAVWSIFPLYLVFSGADKTWVGIAYFVNLSSQFFLMPYVEKFRNLHLINIGLLLSVATFIGYALFPYLPVVLAFQLLLSASFSTLAVGAIQEIMAKNAERSSAVGLLNSIANFNGIIGPFLAGFIAQGFGYQGVMWFGAGAAFLGLICFTTVLE